MNNVTVFGSINLDRTIRTERMPQAGETIHTKEIFSAGGGKGANQAVAAKRLGANTAFIGAVGDDESGELMMELLREENLDLSGVQVLEGVATGQAFIIVDDNSENRILVHGGANMAVKPEDIEASQSMITSSDCLVSQFETPMACIQKAFEIARNNGVMTILNPAPAQKEVSDALLQLTDLIVPNETEAEILTGIKVVDEESMARASEQLMNRGVKNVIITLGSRGAYYHVNGKTGIIPAFKVDAKDTTAAGDTFIGALVSVLNKDFSNIEDAILFGNKASSIAVQHFGAQPSIPTKDEVE